MIAIIEYNAGNIRSVANALRRLGYESRVTRDHDEIRSAEKVIFPGVGEASAAMRYLRNEGLDRLLVSLRQPVLGICLGLQLMCRRSDEGNTEGLGIFDADVRLFPPLDRIPHMGWNTLNRTSGELFRDVAVETDYFFVHSYYAELSPHTVAECDYIIPFSAAFARDNFYATQFHPEKSGPAGEVILKNFLNL